MNSKKRLSLWWALFLRKERKRKLLQAVVIGYIDGFKCYDKANKYKEIVNPRYIKIILTQRGYL